MDILSDIKASVKGAPAPQQNPAAIKSENGNVDVSVSNEIHQQTAASTEELMSVSSLEQRTLHAE